MPAANFPDDQDDLKRLQDEWRTRNNFRGKKIRANIVDQGTRLYHSRRIKMNDETTNPPNPSDEAKVANHLGLQDTEEMKALFAKYRQEKALFAKYRQEKADAKLTAKEIVQRFVADMKAAGATGTAEISFNGFGDSGDWDRAEITKEQQDIMNKLKYCFQYQPDDDGHIALLNHLSHLIPFDWVNNEGGYGHFTFNFDNATAKLTSHMRVETTEDFEETS